MLSMTGYGMYALERDGREMTVEIKTVNHRFLDLNIKTPRGFACLEEPVRKAISAALRRGHTDVTVIYRNKREDSVVVEADAALALQYRAALLQLLETLQLPDQALPDLTYFGSLPNVFRETPAQDDLEAVTSLLRDTLEGALQSVLSMRAHEGEALSRDLSSHVDALERLVQQMEPLANEAPAQYREQLTARIAQLNIELDPDRLAQEVALFADKTAVDEELSRLTSHIAQARALFNSNEPSGKKLDFLIQEMNRECNTVASKSASLALTDLAMSAKNEVEKLREQIQNVE